MVTFLIPPRNSFSVGYSLALPVQPSVSDRFLLSKNICVALSSLFGVFNFVAIIWFNEASIPHIFILKFISILINV